MSPEHAAELPRLGTLNRRRLLAVIAGMAAPVVLANISQTLMGLVDTLMVGRLGEAPLAAVGVATLLFSATAMSIKAVEVAVQTYTARRVGEVAKADAEQQISDAARERDTQIARNAAEVAGEQAKISIAAEIAKAEKDKELKVALVAAEGDLADVQLGQKRRVARPHAEVALDAG